MKLLILAAGALALASCASSADAVLQSSTARTSSQQSLDSKSRVSWLRELTQSSESTPFHVEVHSLDGTILTSQNSIQPSTNYNLVIKSERATHYTLKSTSGFTPLLAGKNLQQLGANTEFTIPILTDADLSTPLFVSIVPLHVRGTSFTKEKPQSFLLLTN